MTDGVDATVQDVQNLALYVFLYRRGVGVARHELSVYDPRRLEAGGELAVEECASLQAHELLRARLRGPRGGEAGEAAEHGEQGSTAAFVRLHARESTFFYTVSSRSNIPSVATQPR